MINVALFAYDFEHKKSLDFFNTIIGTSGFKLTVIAAPWVNIDKHESKKECIKNSKVKDYCNTNDITYISCKHNDFDSVKTIVDEYGLDLGVVSGARIISRNVIELFRDGILNFHPGKIPETSGLDALYHTIRTNCSYGVTAHFIDYRVDAGKLIEFREVAIEPKDSIESLKRKNYELQLKMLSEFLLKYKKDNVQLKEIIRPHKNELLSESDKECLFNNFDTWKSYHYLLQYNSKIFKACENGDLVFLKKLYFSSYIVNLVNEKGWSTLLVAAFNQRVEVCKWLISNGANVNHQNFKGTSVLMFAKTHANGNSELIRVLIENGADPYLKDCFNKDIFYYLNECSQLEMIKFIKDLTV